MITKEWANRYLAMSGEWDKSPVRSAAAARKAKNNGPKPRVYTAAQMKQAIKLHKELGSWERVGKAMGYGATSVRKAVIRYTRAQYEKERTNAEA